jgi:chemotaxis protein CheZ
VWVVEPDAPYTLSLNANLTALDQDHATQGMLKGGETQMVHAPAKVFSVERRGQQIGAAAAVSSVPLPTSEIMDELRALRAEMAELRETVTDRLNGSGIDVLAERDQLSDDDAMKRDVRIEIAQMVRSIGRAKAEIAAIKHPEAGTDQMEVASHQLEAITATTEKSTNEIMTAVDDIESALKKITALTVEDGEVSP